MHLNFKASHFNTLAVNLLPTLQSCIVPARLQASLL